MRALFQERAARPALPFSLLLWTGLFLAGCGNNTSTSSVTHDGIIVDVDADSVTVTGADAKATNASDGRPYQYRAVCLEATKHPQPIFVMSKWVDDITVTRDLGEYHGSWKAKGHHWVIQRRIKPH